VHAVATKLPVPHDVVAQGLHALLTPVAPVEPAVHVADTYEFAAHEAGVAHDEHALFVPSTAAEPGEHAVE